MKFFFFFGRGQSIRCRCETDDRMGSISHVDGAILWGGWMGKARVKTHRQVKDVAEGS